MTLKFNIHSINYVNEGGSGGEIKNQDKNITENGVYTADSGYTGLGRVSVNVETTEPILLTKDIMANGIYNANVDNADGYKSVNVNVPTFEPAGTYTIIENGTYDIADYANANVNVQGGGSEPTVRGRWIVPESCIELDNVMDSDIDYDIITAGYNNSGSLGFVITNDFPKMYIRNYIQDLIGLKTSDGKIYTKEEVYDNYSTFEHVWDTSKDLSSGTRYIILYFATNSTFVPGMLNNNIMNNICGNKSVSATRIQNNILYFVSNFDLSGGVQCYSLESYKFINNHTWSVGTVSLDFGGNLKYSPTADTIFKNATYAGISLGISGERLNFLPYGIDLSKFTNINISNATNSIVEAYIKLPNANITLCSNGVIVPKCWEYIAQNAPTVNNKTLTIGSGNINQIGGSSSNVIQILVNKGWTVN